MRDKYVILVRIGNRGRDGYVQKYLLIWDWWFEMPGIRFVSCHAPRLDTFTVSFLPLPSPRKIGIDYFCHLELLGPRRQGIGSNWPLGKNLFQVICPPQMKMQRWDAVLPGTLIATLYFVFFHPSFFYSACFPPPVVIEAEVLHTNDSYIRHYSPCALSELETWPKRKENKKPLTWGVLINYHLLCHAHLY